MHAREGQELKNASRLVESMPLGTGGRTSMVVDWICRKGVDFHRVFTEHYWLWLFCDYGKIKIRQGY
jgi:hypothetical protein